LLERCKEGVTPLSFKNELIKGNVKFDLRNINLTFHNKTDIIYTENREENKIMKCPNCNVDFENEDLVETYFDDCYVEEWVGTCPKCHKHFKWENVYEFSYSQITEEWTV